MEDNENKQAQRRDVLVPILSTIGTGAVLAAVVSLLGAKWPWLLLIFGIVLILIAVFISVPSIARLLSPVRLLISFGKLVIWWIYKPECHINRPTVNSNISQRPGSNFYELYIEAKIEVWIKNKNKNRELKVDFSSVYVCLEQRVGWEQIPRQFRVATYTGVRESILKPGAEFHSPIMVTDNSHAGESTTYLFDISKDYDLGYGGIWVILPGGIRRELHKGIKCKLVVVYG